MADSNDKISFEPTSGTDPGANAANVTGAGASVAGGNVVSSGGVTTVGTSTTPIAGQPEHHSHLHMPNLHVAETMHRVEHAAQHAAQVASAKMGRALHVVNALHLGQAFEALRTKHVPVHKHSIWYYAGGLALFFFSVQVTTGILLLFYYDPSAAGAHKSVETIVNVVPFGNIIRSVHSWSANGLILVVFLHMFSAFLMKSYRTPREIMWLTGVLLLMLMLGFGFSGYLLPWDQTAYFATKIGTEVPRAMPYLGDFISYFMKGGEEVSGNTLTRMFALHVGVLPVLSLIIVFVHSTLTMLFGSSVPPGARVTGSTKFFPDYVLKESIVWLLGFAVLVTIAILYPWELGAAYDIQNPTEPPAGVHPEWYFMFLFQTLKVVPEWLAIVGQGVVITFWTLVPWLDRRARHNQKSPIFKWIGIAAIAYIVVMTTFAYMSVADEMAEARTEAKQEQAEHDARKAAQPAANSATTPATGSQAATGDAKSSEPAAAEPGSATTPAADAAKTDAAAGNPASKPASKAAPAEKPIRRDHRGLEPGGTLDPEPSAKAGAGKTNGGGANAK